VLDAWSKAAIAKTTVRKVANTVNAPGEMVKYREGESQQRRLGVLAADPIGNGDYIA
jgi:hypothetical protein